MALKNKASIGANGFDCINQYQVDKIVASNTSLKSLATKSTQLSKKMNEISKILETMPVELFEIVGSDILNLGNQMNDVIGIICVAHDKKAGLL